MKQQIRPKQQEEIKDNYFYQLKDNIFQRDFRVDYIFDKDNISVGEGDLILENTENPKFSRFGNKSLKLNINSDENITLNFNFNETKDFSDRIITLWFYIPNEYNVNGLQNVINQEALYLNDGYFSHWGEQNLNRKTGWNYFNMDLGSITDYNTLNLTNLKEVINGRIRLYPNINENFEIYIDSIVSWKAPNFPAIKISFDDWRESVTTNAFPAMVERGIRGCNYPYTDVIGTTETRNPEILLQMERAGWDICSHSKSHPRMSELSNEEIEFELKQSQKDLLDLGLKNGPQFYIAPYGDCAPYAIEYSKKIYKAYRRTGYSKKRRYLNRCRSLCDGMCTCRDL
ncbi:MAG: polysaccharide deacetylase family protein [archaeon]